MMKNIFKKMILVSFVFCVSISSAGIVSKAEENDELIKFNNFDTELMFSGAYVSLTDAEDRRHGSVLKIEAPESVDYSSHTYNTDLDYTGERVMLSYDFNAAQTNHVYEMRTANAAKNAAVNLPVIDEFGQFEIFRTSAVSIVAATMKGPHNNSNVDTSTVYEANQWYTIDMIQDGVNGTIDYYIDGEYITTSAASAIKDTTIGQFSIGTSGYANWLKKDKVPQVGTLYLDNVRLSYPDRAEFVYAEADGETAPGYIVINFSQTPESGTTFDEISMFNTETGEEVEIKSYELQGKNLYLEYEGELAPCTEYVVNFPDDEVKSIVGKSMRDKEIYFISPAEKLEEGETPSVYDDIAYYDFSDDKIGGTVSGSQVNRDVSVKETGDESYGKALHFQGASDWQSYISFTDFEDFSSQRKTIISMDVYLGGLSHDYNFFFMDETGKKVGVCFFNSAGNFLYVKTSVSNWDDNENVEDYSTMYFGAYSGVVEDGSWNQLTLVVDKDTKSTTYYLNGEKIGVTTRWETGANGEVIDEVRLLSTASGSDTYIRVDNIRIGYPKAFNKVLKTRFLNPDDRAYGALSEGKVLSDAEKIELYFSCDVDTSTIDNSTVILTDGEEDIGLTFENYDNRVQGIAIDRLLKPDTTYYLTVSGVETVSGLPLDDYSVSFKTSNLSEFLCTKFTMDDSGSINANIKNTYTDSKVATVYIAAYKDNELIELTEETVEAKRLSYTPISIAPQITDDYMKIVAIITDEDGVPIAEKQVVGEDSEIADDFLTVTVEGTTDESQENVFVKVTSPDEETVFVGQTLTDEENKFSLKFKMNENAKSGVYNVNYQSKSKVSEYTVLFVNENETNKAVENINNAAKLSKSEAVLAIKNIVDESKFAFGIDDADIDFDMVAELIYDSVDKNGDFSGVSEGIEFINKAAVVEQISEAKISDLFSEAEALMLDESKISGWYEKSYITDEMKKDITSKLEGIEFSNMEEFYDELLEEFILSVVESPDGINNLKELMKEFYAEIGISKNGTDKQYRAVMHNKYSSYKDLASDFNKAIESSGGSGGSGGGSSSGGRGTGGASGMTAPNPNVNTAVSIPNEIFSDLDSVEWAKEAIVNLAERGIINGKTDKLFCPEDNITRAEAVKLVAATFAKNAESAQVSFEDVGKETWYYEYVAKAYGAGIVKGYSDQWFGANDLVTREDIAVMIYKGARFYGLEFATDTKAMFADEDMISDYAKESISALYNNDIINGIDGEHFAPKGFATRAQTAKIIYEILNM